MQLKKQKKRKNRLQRIKDSYMEETNGLSRNVHSTIEYKNHF